MNNCNSNGEAKEEYEKGQMAFMAIRDDEFTYFSDDENDDDIKAVMVKLHDDLKIKIIVLLKKNAKKFSKKTKF